MSSIGCSSFGRKTNIDYMANIQYLMAHWNLKSQSLNRLCTTEGLRTTCTFFRQRKSNSCDKITYRRKQNDTLVHMIDSCSILLVLFLHIDIYPLVLYRWEESRCKIIWNQRSWVNIGYMSDAAPRHRNYLGSCSTHSWGNIQCLTEARPLNDWR